MTANHFSPFSNDFIKQEMISIRGTMMTRSTDQPKSYAVLATLLASIFGFALLVVQNADLNNQISTFQNQLDAVRIGYDALEPKRALHVRTNGRRLEKVNAFDGESILEGSGKLVRRARELGSSKGSSSKGTKKSSKKSSSTKKSSSRDCSSSRTNDSASESTSADASGSSDSTSQARCEGRFTAMTHRRNSILLEFSLSFIDSIHFNRFAATSF